MIDADSAAGQRVWIVNDDAGEHIMMCPQEPSAEMLAKLAEKVKRSVSVQVFILSPVSKEGLGKPELPCLRITLRQALKLVEFFGNHDADVTVTPPRANWEQQMPGLYAFCTEYPEDGAQYLGATELDDELMRLGCGVQAS
jgi:hypothetical protein